MDLSKTAIAGMIDHTYLKPDANTRHIACLCREAQKHGFYAVCVPPAFVRQATLLLTDTPIKIATVVGFPLGFQTPEAKTFEAKKAVFDGAHEVDMVINIGMLQEGNLSYVEHEIGLVTDSLSANVVVKVIIETSLLTEHQKTAAAKLIMGSGAHFIKTSTGYASAGATIEDVRLLKYIVGDSKQIKASGGIRSLEFAQQLVYAGASRLGCSCSVDIVS